MIKLSIHLIRHGEKKLFLPNPALTELGKSQATTLANKLALTKQSADNKHALILASPLQRTHETAIIVAGQLHLPVITDEFLNVDRRIKQNPEGKKQIIKHFSNYFKTDDSQIELGEIFAVTHSQNIKNYWQVLAGPSKAIVDVYECGVWTIIVEGERVNFEWTEGDLNP